MAEILTAHWIYRSYASMAVAIPAVLAVVGVIDSLFGGTGEDILAWYFVGFEFIYIFWPWQFELRFLFPNTVLACLFIYRGARKMAYGLALPAPRRRASTRLHTLCGSLRTAGQLGHPVCRVQSNFCRILVRGIALSVWVICESPPTLDLSGRPVFSGRFYGSLSLTFLQVGATWVSALLYRAISKTTRANLAFEEEAGVPDVLRTDRLHTDPLDVITARHVPLAFHYSQRKVIWFAPIVRPQVMMEGFRRLGIRYVIVVDRDFSYYLPPDEVCFDMVQRAYPNAFRLVAQFGQARIYEVIPAGVDGAANP
jgi:hypothetical protein